MNSWAQPNTAEHGSHMFCTVSFLNVCLCMNRTTGGAWILKRQPWPQGNYLKQLPKLHLLWWKIKKSAAKIKEALEHFDKLLDFEETTFFKNINDQSKAGKAEICWLLAPKMCPAPKWRDPTFSHNATLAYFVTPFLPGKRPHLSSSATSVCSSKVFPFPEKNVWLPHPRWHHYDIIRVIFSDLTPQRGHDTNITTNIEDIGKQASPDLCGLWPC